ncbi:hypothetical protein ACJRO7_006456 [Eucalyptus globulus]|uniref:Uncharacterized protein n=1 Tax=Eucalyptus globulus TaxID=34317 RepID=A0ABD3IJE9_EUCGL
MAARRSFNSSSSSHRWRSSSSPGPPNLLRPAPKAARGQAVPRRREARGQGPLVARGGRWPRPPGSLWTFWDKRGSTFRLVACGWTPHQCSKVRSRFRDDGEMLRRRRIVGY